MSEGISLAKKVQVSWPRARISVRARTYDRVRRNVAVAAELHTDGIGIDGSAVAVPRHLDQSRLQPFLVEAADAASTQRGLARSEVVGRRG